VLDGGTDSHQYQESASPAMREAVPTASMPVRVHVRSVGGVPSMLIVVVAVVCAALAQHRGDVHQLPLWLIPVTLAAIVAAALAFPAPFALVGVPPLPGLSEGRRPVIGGAILGGFALVACLVWATEPFAEFNQYFHTASTYAALFWVAGLLLGLAVLWPINHQVPGARGSLGRFRPSPWLVLELLVLVLILDLAAGLRIWHLGSLPEGVWFDEADFAVSARQLLSVPFQPFGLQELGHSPSLFFYVEALILKLLGASMAAVRLTPALFGTGAVLAVYLLGRAAGSATLGLCAAAVLAMTQWAIDFSRLDMSTIAPATLIGLGFAALAVSMRRPRGFWFALSGVLLGLAVLTYASGFLSGIAVAMVVIGLRYVQDPEFRRASWPQVLLLPLGAVVGAAPLIVPFLQDPNFVLARPRQVSIFTEYSDWPQRLTAIGSNLKVHLLMFSVQGDNNGRHNLPGAPMLDAVTGACLLLGVGMALRRARHWFFQLLLLWFIANMLGGILSLDFEAPQGDRTAGATAPIALLAALPLAALAYYVRDAVEYVARSLRRRASSSPETGRARSGFARATGILLAAAVVGTPLGFALSNNVNGYFVAHAHDSSSWVEMGGLQAIVGRAAVTLADHGYTVMLPPALEGDPALDWAAGERSFPSYDPQVPVQLLVPSGGLALIIPSSDSSVITFVRQSYPHAAMIPLTPAFDKADVAAEVLLVRAADAARNRGMTVQFGAGAAATTFEHVAGSVTWPQNSGRTTTVQIGATLLVGGAQAWRIMSLRVAGLRQGKITIDGTTWNDATRGTGPIRLGAGNHSLTVSGEGKAGPVIELQAAQGLSSAAPSWTAVPAASLGSPNLPSGGWLGIYYPGPTIAGTPTVERVDATIDTYFQNPPQNMGFPFATRWLGSMRAPTTGNYGFSLDSTGPSSFFIDGTEVMSGGPGGTKSLVYVPLTGGPHQIRVDYQATGSYVHCYLEWRPPGQSAFTAIPARVMEPAHG
jgi:hypothetical protein